MPVSDRDDAWDAAWYRRHSSLQQEMAANALSGIALRGDERVLDIGCGDGRVSALIAMRKVPRGSVLGIDASVSMIEAARRAHAVVGRLNFELGDASRLRFDAAFEAVVSFNALHWLHDIAPALRGIHTALVPGGRAWLRLVTRGPVVSLEEVAEQVRHRPHWMCYFDDFEDPYLRLTPAEVAAAASRAALHVRANETRIEHWDFGSRDAFLGFCRAGCGAWTTRLPPARRDDFLGEVSDCYLSFGTNDAAIFRFYQTSLELIRD